MTVRTTHRGRRASSAKKSHAAEPDHLRELSRLRSRTLESSINAVAIADLDGNLTYVNDAFLTLWGYDETAEVLGKAAAQFWRNEQKARRVAAVLLSKGEWSGDIVARRKDDSSFAAHISACLIKDGAHAPTCMLASFVDITDCRRAEAALRQSEERFRDLYENAPAAYFSVGVDGLIRRCSRRAEDLLGYTPEDLVGRPVFDLYADTPQGKCRARELFERFRASEEIRDEELQMRKADGTPIWISLTVNIVRDSAGRVEESRSMVVDISERKRAEEALRQSEANYRNLFENVQDVFFRSDLDGTLREVTPSIEAYGYRHDQVIGSPVLPHYENPRQRAAMVKELLEKGEVGDYEVRLKAGDGRPIYISVNARLVRSPDGGCPVIEGSLRDISERKQAEEALRTSEKKYRRLVQDSIDGIAVARGVEVRFVNRALVKMMGYQSESEMLGRPFTDFISPEHREPALRAVRAALRGERAPARYEHTAVRKDGSEFPVEVSAGVISYQGRRAFQVIVRDITTRKRMEEIDKTRREKLEIKVERQMRRGDAYGLTFRERTVLNLMAEGKSDKDIGAELGISPLTVHRHVVNILNKMRVSCRTQACVRALREGLLD